MAAPHPGSQQARAGTSTSGATSSRDGFDELEPPSAELLADCVHCGFCLPSCPTYVLWGEEMDSPRGRIYLMSEVLGGEPLTETVAGHFDSCLGCMACVTACPSGVQYDKLIEATRAQIERRVRRPRVERILRWAIFSLFPYPRRLRVAVVPLHFYQRSGLAWLVRRTGLRDRLPVTLRTLESLAPPLRRREGNLPGFVAAQSTRRGKVGLLTGCVQRVVFAGVNAATARVLAVEGFDVAVPPRQGCCGALSAHAGRIEEARGFARTLIDCFDRASVDAVIVNSAGCGSAMKEYGHLLRDDPAFAERALRFAASVRDVAEFLDERGQVADHHPLALRVAYHDACHLRHAQGVVAAPRRVLSSVPGLEVLEIPEGEICCGSAGVYNLLEPEPATELGDRKASNVLSTDARVLVAANPGCSMQIAAAVERRGGQIAIAHTAEILDASIRNLGPASLAAR
jgi:glycolate oxidase iron-sulfur subunit